jgi:hypothetical protein
MRKLLFIGLFLIIIAGTVQAIPQVTEGPGISFYVTGLNDGMNVQVDVDGSFSSNGDGTYGISCPFTMPVELRTGKLKIWLYSGTGKWNQLQIVSGGNTFSWAQPDYYFDIRENFPPGSCVITAQGQTDYEKVNAKFQLTGKKYGPRDFYIDANGITGSGTAKVRVLIGGVKKFEKTYTFGSKIAAAPTPAPVITKKVTPAPTPTPKPTKSPGQIWAERNCWWYRT